MIRFRFRCSESSCGVHVVAVKENGKVCLRSHDYGAEKEYYRIVPTRQTCWDFFSMMADPQREHELRQFIPRKMVSEIARKRLERKKLKSQLNKKYSLEDRLNMLIGKHMQAAVAKLLQLECNRAHIVLFARRDVAEPSFVVNRRKKSCSVCAMVNASHWLYFIKHKMTLIDNRYIPLRIVTEAGRLMEMVAYDGKHTVTIFYDKENRTADVMRSLA